MTSEDSRTETEQSPEPPMAEPSPHTSARSPPTTSGSRVAAVLAHWFLGNTGPYTEYECWLQGRFAYWARQLRNKVSDPQGELLSALGTKLEKLDKPMERGYVERILRSAFLDILRRERGRGSARDAVEYLDDVSDVSSGAADQVKQVELLQRLEELVARSPKGAEALQLRAQGLPDKEACKQSKWRCSPQTFRRRVRDAHAQLRKSTK